VLDHCGTVELKTRRLLLRRFAESDAPAVFANWGADDEVYRFMTSKVMKTPPEVGEFLRGRVERYKKKDFYYWAVVPYDAGEPVGMVSFTELAPWQRTANLAYALGKKWWGLGYAKEAAERAMGLMFGRVGVRTVTGSHFEGNVRSGRTLLSLGMRHVGRSRERYECNGACLRCDDYEITAEEYYARAGTLEGIL